MSDNVSMKTLFEHFHVLVHLMVHLMVDCAIEGAL